jgi:hypothetical protein
MGVTNQHEWGFLGVWDPTRSQVMVKPLGHAYNCHLNHVLKYHFFWWFEDIDVYIYTYILCVYNIYIYTHQWELDFCSFLTSPDVGCIFWVHKNARFSSWMRHALLGFPTSMQLCYPSNLESPFSGVIIGRGVWCFKNSMPSYVCWFIVPLTIAISFQST